MYGLADVQGISTHLDGQCHFADEIASTGADNAATDDAMTLLIEQQLGEAFITPVGNRAASRRPKEKTVFDLDALGLGLVFGSA